MLSFLRNVAFWPRTVFFHGISIKYQKTIGILLVITILTIFYTQVYIQRFEESCLQNPVVSSFRSNKPRYLINTPKCKIADHDPFSPDIKKFIKSWEYLKCTDKGLLTYIEKNGTNVILHKNQSVSSSYSLAISCCYEVIRRDANSDHKIYGSDCTPFENSVKLNETDAFIKVQCLTDDFYLYGKLYVNVHAIINSKSVVDIPKQTPNSTKFSVIFVGIDSMSKLNLARAMPKVFNFLEKNDSFVNLKGYTKVGDNTFPNLVSILTGRRWEQLYDFCNPAKNDMNKCNLIWTTFKQAGYLTAYAEDETDLNTFTYGRKGFFKPPTDFYFRPYFLAAERLGSKKLNGLFTCTGPENSGERIMNLAKDFVSTFRDLPKFGLFWTSSFSHDDFNMASMMDDKVLNFLQEMQEDLNDTIFVFFSDHGTRFGDIRYTYTGWLEERIPFIYVYLPVSFKNLYPDKYANFLVNSKRLTSPFDVYMTLQDVLQLGDKSYKTTPSQGCPKCQSLFKEVDELRTCRDAGIDDNYCACSGYHYINVREPIVQHVGSFIVQYINKLIESYGEETDNNCAFYSINRVFRAGVATRTVMLPTNRTENVNNFVVLIETSPADAMFEATVEVVIHDSESSLRLLGDISRINRYGMTSDCVSDPILKKYCYCNTVFTSIKSAICRFINCK